MTKLAPGFWHSFSLPLRAAGTYLQMSSVLQGHATDRCFNRTTVKYSYPWVHRLRPELLSCTTYLWHLPEKLVVQLHSWNIGKIRSSWRVCVKCLGTGVVSWICLFPHTLGQERAYAVTTMGLFTDYGRIKLLFWNNLSSIRLANIQEGRNSSYEYSDHPPRCRNGTSFDFCYFLHSYSISWLLVWLPESSSTTLGKATGYIANLYNGRVYAKYSS